MAVPVLTQAMDVMDTDGIGESVTLMKLCVYF